MWLVYVHFLTLTLNKQSRLDRKPVEEIKRIVVGTVGRRCFGEGG